MGQEFFVPARTLIAVKLLRLPMGYAGSADIFQAEMMDLMEEMSKTTKLVKKLKKSKKHSK